MKKYIILPLLLSAFTLVGAQSPALNNSNRVILTHKDGTTQTFRFSDLQSLEFDHIETPGVAVSVVDNSLSPYGFSVSAVPSADCHSYTVSLFIDDSDIAVCDAASYQGNQTLTFTDLVPATDYKLEVVASDKYGISETPQYTFITTESLEITPAPKVGDYYYSDGTWSDGGLISIDLDGRNAVWSEVKPMPVEGKTVLGIVCMTDPNRIAEEDKADGYTHGYVISCKNITDPSKENYSRWPETVWYGAKYSEGDETQVVKLSMSCYARLSGRADTQEVLSKYPGEESVKCPMFYRLSDLPQAPAQSSGWFVPSVGQLWDCLANFCSGQVAEKLFQQRTVATDFTYYFDYDLGFNVKDRFMAPFQNIPAADKDDITLDDGTGYIELRTSNRYDTEATIIFNLGTNETGIFEGMAAWRDEDAHARAFLAF